MLNVAQIVDLMKDEGELTQYRVPRGLLLAGNPVQTLKHHYLSPCGQFSCGFWESTPGQWTVEYDEAEYNIDSINPGRNLLGFLGLTEVHAAGQFPDNEDVEAMYSHLASI